VSQELDEVVGAIRGVVLFLEEIDTKAAKSLIRRLDDAVDGVSGKVDDWSAVAGIAGACRSMTRAAIGR